MSTSPTRCPGCGGVFPAHDGPTHRYLESSPGCWAAYGEVLAREYGDPALFGRVHRLTVDSYAVQHPGSPSPQSIQSVALHLLSLCLMLEHGATPQQATAAMQSGAQAKACYFWLAPPTSPGAITVADVQMAKTPQAHEGLVREWARATWAAWSVHHMTIQSWLDSLQLR